MYMAELFCEDTVNDEHHLLSELPDYFIQEGDLKAMKETIRSLPRSSSGVRSAYEC